MKSFKVILALSLGGLSLGSCSSDNNEVIEDEVKVQTTFTVSANLDTRAYWSDNAIFWNQNDLTKVFANHHSEGDEFHIVEGTYVENYRALQFTGKTYKDHTQYYIVYPASQASTLNDDGTVNVTIPEIQQAHRGTFDPQACIQIGGAKNLNQTIQFDNVCAFFKIYVTAPCEYVEIEPNKQGYGIAGTVKVNYQGAINPDNGWTERKHTVRLENLQHEGTYLIGVGPSDSYDEGITVRVKFPDINVLTRSTSKDLQINKGYVYDLGRCDKPVN